MKKIILLFYFLIELQTAFTQAPQIDSLKKLLASTKEDTIKVEALVKLSFYDQTFQHGLDLAEEALQLSRKIKYKKGEAHALHQLGNQYGLGISNYPRALYYYLEALKIEEDLNDINGIASSYQSIGSIYLQQGDYEKALMYSRKANAMYHNNDFYRLAGLHFQLAFLFSQLNKQDSALKYIQSSYEYFNKTTDKYQFGLTLIGLGYLQLSKGSKELALGYYREAVKNDIAYNDTLGLSFAYLQIANYYDGEHQPDSSILYANKSLSCAQRTGLENVIQSGKLLSKLYTDKDDKKALQYLQIAQRANDSLFSRERTMKLQNMLFDETQRENELAEKEKKDAEERKQNIEYALIALGIIIFIILFLLLSRTVIVNERLISFFAILGLLVVFEFINLLIHPWLASFTHDSPVLMLLALVIIASLLIPMHHRLEQWIKEKMIKKNKAIRLAAAKKTIEKLEKK